MLGKVKVCADSTCDLSPELIEKYGIHIIPLHVITDEGDFRDGVDISPDLIYKYVDRTGKLPHTAAVSEAEYYECFKKYVDQGQSVIHVNLSTGFSTCFQNAKNAAEKLGNVYVVDSKNLSSGSGHLVMIAADLAEAGMDAKDIYEELLKTVPRVEASFLIDTLLYLYKGGRCSSLARLGANLLKLKPCIEVVDGLMTVGKKYKGTLSTSLEKYVEDRLKDRRDLLDRRIFITHTGCSKEIVEMVRETINKFQHFDEVIETRAGCTVTTHAGPGTLGILFVRKETK